MASCLVLRATDPEAFKDPAGNPYYRPYTPISTSDTAGEITFLVKRYEAGNFSKYIHSLKVFISFILNEHSEFNATTVGRRDTLRERPLPEISLQRSFISPTLQQVPYLMVIFHSE